MRTARQSLEREIARDQIAGVRRMPLDLDAIDRRLEALDGRTAGLASIIERVIVDRAAETKTTDGPTLSVLERLAFLETECALLRDAIGLR